MNLERDFHKLFSLSPARKPGQQHLSTCFPLVPLKQPFAWSEKLWRTLVTIPAEPSQLSAIKRRELKKVKMWELFPTTQKTAGKHQELPCDQTRWAAAWGWWTASSWPALKLLQIHPPQLEMPPEDPAHLFPSCLGWILALPDKETLSTCVFAEHRWLLSQEWGNVILYVQSWPWLTHRRGWAVCDLTWHCSAALQPSERRNSLVTWRKCWNIWWENSSIKPFIATFLALLNPSVTRQRLCSY